jgi:hypothetical protein
VPLNLSFHLAHLAMRLLKTSTLELVEFFESDVPDYAILSHRWQQDEVNFKDMKPKHRVAISNKAGFLKVRALCKRTARDGFGSCWIDTCCINKDSSSELSEAIDSMYRWYRDAKVCYV